MAQPVSVKIRPFPVSNAQDYLAAIPNATLVVLPGIGHVPQEEAPQETIIPLRDFLAR